jgi:hypothetical protein
MVVPCGSLKRRISVHRCDAFTAARLARQSAGDETQGTSLWVKVVLADGNPAAALRSISVPISGSRVRPHGFAANATTTSGQAPANASAGIDSHLALLEDRQTPVLLAWMRQARTRLLACFHDRRSR